MVKFQSQYSSAFLLVPHLVLTLYHPTPDELYCVTMFYIHLSLKYTVNGVQSLPSFVLCMGDAEVTQAGSLPLVCQVSVSCTGWGQGRDRGVCPMPGGPGGGPEGLLNYGGRQDVERMGKSSPAMEQEEGLARQRGW